MVQATFVEECSLLTFTLQHQVGDMTALAQVMHLLDKACHGEELTEEELRIGNVDRRTVFPLFEGIEKVVRKEQGSLSKSPVSSNAKARPGTEAVLSIGAAPLPPTLSWANIAFSAASLAALKLKPWKTCLVELTYPQTMR